MGDWSLQILRLAGQGSGREKRKKVDFSHAADPASLSTQEVLNG